MKRRAIVFIDGNNFYHNVKRIIDKPKKIDFNKLADFICLKFDLNLVEIIYYNSIPSVSKSKTYEKHLEFLDALKKEKITVKTRELHGRGNIKERKELTS